MRVLKLFLLYPVNNLFRNLFSAAPIFAYIASYCLSITKFVTPGSMNMA